MASCSPVHSSSNTRCSPLRLNARLLLLLLLPSALEGGCSSGMKQRKKQWENQDEQEKDGGREGVFGVRLVLARVAVSCDEPEEPEMQTLCSLTLSRVAENEIDTMPTSSSTHEHQTDGKLYVKLRGKGGV